MTVNVKVYCDTTGVKAADHMGPNWALAAGASVDHPGLRSSYVKYKFLTV